MSKYLAFADSREFSWDNLLNTNRVKQYVEKLQKTAIGPETAFVDMFKRQRKKGTRPVYVTQLLVVYIPKNVKNQHFYKTSKQSKIHYCLIPVSVFVTSLCSWKIQKNAFSPFLRLVFRGRFKKPLVMNIIAPSAIKRLKHILKSKSLTLNIGNYDGSLVISINIISL